MSLFQSVSYAFFSLWASGDTSSFVLLRFLCPHHGLLRWEIRGAHNSLLFHSAIISSMVNNNIAIALIKTGNHSPPAWLPLLCREGNMPSCVSCLGISRIRLSPDYLWNPLSQLEKEVARSPCVCAWWESPQHINSSLQTDFSKLQSETFNKTWCVGQRLRVL